jgi:RHS repeat-associated protein
MAKSALMVAAGKASSFSRPARRVETRPAERIPVCVEPPTPFVEGPGPSKAWWEKALSEKSFSGAKHGNSQQNQDVGAKSRTTNLGPFGEPIRMTGAMAKNDPFRFSTKYDDDESDLLYYGYRCYNPSTGRWVNRDPNEERGGLNLYGFASGDSINRSDFLGLDAVPFHGNYGFYIDGFGFKTTDLDGNWIFSCVAGAESSSIDMNPGLTGFTGLGGSLFGNTIGFTITADTSNNSRFEPCGCGKRQYVVDLKVVVKKNFGIILNGSIVVDTLRFNHVCPCQ